MCVFLRLATTLTLLMVTTIASAAGPQAANLPRPATPQTVEARPLRVLFVGNSLTYVNNLPRLLAALATAQPGGPRIETLTYVEAGGSVDQRWDDGQAASALRAGHWDALVLQESSGLPACMASSESRRKPRCRDSVRAHKRFAELAQAGGTRVLLLTTWGPSKRWQRNIDQGYDMLAFALRGVGVQYEVVPAAHAMDAYAEQHDRKAALPDDLHPSLSLSLIMAAQLYRSISGQPAQAHDVRLDFLLLPVDVALKPGTPLEQQSHLARHDKSYLLKSVAIAPLLQVAYAPR